METYDSLTPREKMRRLRRLASVALTRYDLPAAQLVFLSQGDNLVFRVDAHDRFVLRIHISKRHSPAMLASELLWLAALRQDTSLLVPTPIRTVQGALVADFADAHVPETYACVLFRSLPERYEQRLDSFTLLRTLDLAAEILDWPYPTLRPWGPRFLSTVMPQVQQYLSNDV